MAAKKFTPLKEGYASLEADDLEALSNSALEELKELLAKDDNDVTDEEFERIAELQEGVTAIHAENQLRLQKQEERSAKLAAARAAVEETAKPDEKPAEETPAEEAPAEVEAEAEALEPVVASGSKRPFVAKLVGKVKEPEAPAKEPVSPGFSLIAAADIPGIPNSAELADSFAVAEAFDKRTRGLSSKGRGSRSVYGIATIKLDVDPELHIDEKATTTANMAAFSRAANESRLPGESLVAAGGWCAPTENVYNNFLRLEQVDGVLDLPTVTWSRGGINFTKGPDFADVLANVQADFVQTEAQAEAGEEKPFTTYDCPEWEEIRPFATGYGIRGNILMDHGFPEIKQRYIEMVTVAHALRTNVRTINTIVPWLGAATTARIFGSVATDTLDALELAVQRLRYKYSMGLNQTVDGFAPAWLIAIIRADLSRRTGQQLETIGDAQIKAHFAARGANIQWIRGWNDLATTGNLEYPTKAQIALYPAGTFVAGDQDVIELTAVHDYDSLKKNMYTAVFSESARLVAQMGASGLLLEVGDLQRYGRTGAADITVAAGA